MIDAMKAEFDSVAGWTAAVALDLGPDYLVPAGCRGSGNPATLRWFLERLAVTSADRMLDCGAGIGGPAAFAAGEVGVRPVLLDPEAGACRGARRLFDLPVVQAGSDLPFASGAVDVAWSLGVLCTVPDQRRLLTELHRVLAPDGRLGLLVFVARTVPLPEQPAGNNFPTADGLRTLLAGCGFTIEDSATADDYASSPPLWTERTEAVAAELQRRHEDDPAWQAAARQSEVIGRLLAAGDLVGTMIAARAV